MICRLRLDNINLHWYTGRYNGASFEMDHFLLCAQSRKNGYILEIREYYDIIEIGAHKHYKAILSV